MSGRPIPVPELVAFAATRRPQSVHPADLWRDGYDLNRWNTFGGSQNTFPVAHMATGDWRWLVALAWAWIKQGLWGKEFGGPGFYFTSVVTCLVLALREARAANDSEAITALSTALRAVWAWEALTAVPWPRTSSLIIFARPGEPQSFRGPGEVAYGYHGPTCAVAGDRWIFHAAEGIKTQSGKPEPGGYPDRDPHGGWLAWALDMPRRDASGSSAALRRVRPPKTYNIVNAMGHALGVDDYEHPVAPELFGLTAHERDLMRRVITTGGVDRAALDAVVAMVAAAPPGPWHRHTLRRTTEGIEHVCWVTNTGNKNTLAYAAVDEHGNWIGVRPCNYKGTGANIGYFVTEDGPNHLRFGCGAGERARIERLGGPETWRVEVLDGRVELSVGTPPAPPEPKPPEPPQPPPSKPPEPEEPPTTPDEEEWRHVGLTEKGGARRSVVVRVSPPDAKVELLRIVDRKGRR